MEEQKTYYRSPVGILEIIGSEAAITGLNFIDREVTDVAATPACLQECVRQLDQYFATNRKDFSLSLQLVGSEFEKRVWQELLKIPFGQTLSYIELARRLGDEKSVRAVGRANGKNPIAIIIPCHRVIGSRGELIGYGGGLWRKEWLLEHEGGLVQPRL
ncbi:MAG: methylated-DNA--[protein]-cysteine S-methyltransferase, partial [Acidobacteriota bacterium]